MSRLIYIALLVLMTINISAQDGLAEQPYRLRQPSAEEYVSAIPEILNQWEIDMEDVNSQPQSIFNALSYEAHIQYGKELQTLNATNLYHVFNLLFAESYFETNRELWMQAILLAWLEQNQIDLDTFESFTFEDIHIQVTPRDFDSDEQDEYLLDIQSDLYSQFIVIKSTDSGYEIVDTPLPWYGCCFMYYSNLSGLMEEQYFGDLNNDGIPEWVLAEGGIGGGHMSHGRLFVLQWQDGQLIEVTLNPNHGSADSMTYRSGSGGGAPLFPRGVQVEFKDINDDSRTEIIILQTFYDNWDCVSYDTRIFDWNDDISRYDLQENTREFENSAGCNLRHAQDAMWEQDYVRAIPFFERALELYSIDSVYVSGWSFTLNDVVAYANIRLALAYAMTDQVEAAQEIVNIINNPPDDPFIAEFVESAQLSLIEGTEIDLCIAMYSTFASYYRFYEANPYWGVTKDVPTPWTGMSAGNPGADAEKAGCVIQEYIDGVLNNSSLSIRENPIEYLEDAHIPIASSFKSDLNQDGHEDWLVWFDNLRRGATFYLSSRGSYQAIQTGFSFINELADYTDWFSWELPNGTPVWGVIFFDNEHSFGEVLSILSGGGGGGPVSYCTNANDEYITDLYPGYIELYTLVDNDLYRIFSANICESIQLDELFIDGISTQEIALWRRVLDDSEYSDYPIVPATYIWDDDTGTYIYPEVETVQTTEIPQKNDEYNEVNLNSYDISRAISNNEFETVIKLANDYLNNSSNARDFSSDDTRTAYHYRAFAYQQLGQYNEALADYVTLYTEASDTSWGMLAGLHIEPTTNN